MTPLILGLAALACILASVAWSRRNATHRPVAQLPAPSPQALQLIGHGQQVKAIKAYRQQTGATLHEAAQVIEHHQAPR